ncbi:MAG: FprA family A-type flavoprotein [Spirochaetia bacterium]|nr:FprA family A-type flavoprotein [Spirochaetia bacterium]
MNYYGGTTVHTISEIQPSLYWVGASDRRLERFENLFPIPQGVSYNSYLFKDTKTALLDTVDSSVTQQFLENVTFALDGRSLDYLVVNHMEPDHCANIEELVRRYPEVKVVGNKKTFQLFSQFYSLDITKNQYLVKEGDILDLGDHKLEFFFAPMVHWPEVMLTYERTKKILFSADAFGTFGALGGNLFADQIEYERHFLSETRRYYANILGKFGLQVQAAFAKLPVSSIAMLCPLHGPIWRENIQYIFDKYRLWSTYTPEREGVVIAYASMYGNTESAVNKLAKSLSDRGIRDIRMFDVSRTHISEIVAEVWENSHLVVASPTYNMHLYSGVANLLDDLSALGLKNRKVAILGNHSWASAAKKGMEEMVSDLKDCEIVASMDIKSSLKEEQLDELASMADAIAASMDLKKTGS